ncbi:hypothetical protein BaRGS_00013951, partial [Batillaria attramentaria]
PGKMGGPSLASLSQDSKDKKTPDSLLLSGGVSDGVEACPNQTPINYKLSSILGDVQLRFSQLPSSELGKRPAMFHRDDGSATDIISAWELDTSEQNNRFVRVLLFWLLLAVSLDALLQLNRGVEFVPF